ncbi:hypothetical protein BDAP_000766 [Binucleata daphniae]
MSFYEILYVPKCATQGEVKEAYQKLALDFHPDKDRGNKEIFIEISEAYRVLGCERKRSLYDFFGTKGLRLCSNDSSEFIFTRMLSLKALKLFIFCITLLLVSIGTFPTMFGLKNVCKVVKYYSLSATPFVVTFLSFLVYGMYSITLIHKHRSAMTKKIAKNIFFGCIGVFLLLVAILSGFLYVDFNVKTNVFHTLPFLIFDTFLLIIEIFEQKSNVNVNLREVVASAISRFILRYFIALIFFIDFSFRYKFLLCALFVIYECYVRGVDFRISLICSVVVSFYLGLCTITFFNTKIPMYICFSCFYCGYFVCLYKLVMLVYKNMPQSKYLKQKMLMYVEKCYTDDVEETDYEEDERNGAIDEEII